MNPIKTLLWMIMFGMLYRGSAADDLAVSPPVIIETPSLIHIPDNSSLHGAVVASGTNAVFVWAKGVGDGTTNLLFTPLDASGRPIDTPPQFVASEFYISAYSELYPAESGFFVRYFDKTNANSTMRLLATRIDADGNQAFAPVVISTNAFKKSDTASNGRSLLLLVENYRTAGIKLDYTLLGWNGGIISTGVLDGASGGHSFAVASDGKDFVAVWSASVGRPLRVTRFSGSDGSVSTADFGTNSMFVQTISHGKNGYLVAGGGSLMHLRDDGTLISKTPGSAIGGSAIQNILFPEDEGWIRFESDSFGAIRTFRITPTSEGLHVDDIPPYPFVQGDSTVTFTPPLVGTISPFGPGRFLLVRNNGVSVLTKIGVTEAAKPPMYVPQLDSGIVASPFGYLMTWTERRDLGYSIRGLRVAPDGSRLDDHSFEIGDFYSRRTSRPSLLFDGKDYLVGWNVFDAPVRVARISPQGAPDVRLESYAIDTGPYGIALIAQKGELFACRGALTFAVPDAHIWKLGADGQAGPELIVHGYGAASDGTNLFSIGINDSLQLYKIAIDPDVPNPEISTNVIARANTGSASFATLRHGFVVQWYEPLGDSFFAYFSDGQERLRAPSPKYFAHAFADSDDRLLMVSLPGSRGPLRFDTFNLQTGDRSSVEADLGGVLALHLGSSGADFLAMTESFNPEFQFVGKFWITTAKLPAFAAPRIEQERFSATLDLNPGRRYRIETSIDLLNWNLQQVVSGSQSSNITLPGGSQGFVRAILVPE